MKYLTQKVRSSLSSYFHPELRLLLRRMQFRGKNEYCVLCKSSVDKFNDVSTTHEVNEQRLVAGSKHDSKAICPVCYGGSRQRLITLYFEMNGNLNSKTKLLHMAPDISIYLWLNNQQHQLNYTASDLNIERYTMIPDVHSANIMSMPFEDNEFDYIICSHILEHIPDDYSAMKELKRILKPGGQLLTMVPEALDGKVTDEDPSIQDPKERGRRFGQHDHVRLYARGDFDARLRECGFSVTSFDGFSDLPEKSESLKLNADEILWIAKK